MKKDVVEKIEEEIEQQKRLSTENKKQIFKKMFINYVVSILIMIYFLLIILGKIYIDKGIFILSSRIATFTLLSITLVLFEISYKKDRGTIAIYGIELMMVSIFSLFIPFIFFELDKNILNYIMPVGIYMSIYYIIKSIFVYRYHKRKCLRELSDINQIIKREPKKRKDIIKKNEKILIPDTKNIKDKKAEIKKEVKKQTKNNIKTTKLKETGIVEETKPKRGRPKKTEQNKEVITKKIDNTKNEKSKQTENIKKETKKTKKVKQIEKVDKPKKQSEKKTTSARNKKDIGEKNSNKTVNDNNIEEKALKEQPEPQYIVKKRGRPRKAAK